MIHSVLIINTTGVPRLVKFYTPVDAQIQQTLIKQVSLLLNQRSPNQCNFITRPKILQESLGGEDGEDNFRVIYRKYATLYFVFIVDHLESELGIIDLIQVFVESLDRCFENVCELDLVFGWEVLETVLEEIIQGGLVLETNVGRIVAAVDQANKTGTLGGDDAISAASKAISNATLLLKSYVNKDTRRS